jgi:hypothetical protein
MKRLRRYGVSGHVAGLLLGDGAAQSRKRFNSLWPPWERAGIENRCRGVLSDGLVVGWGQQGAVT